MSEDHKELLERLERLKPIPTNPVARVFGQHRNPDGPEAATVIRALQAELDTMRQDGQWRPIADHDNSTDETLVATDKGRFVVARRHHPSSRTDVWLSVPGAWQITPVRFMSILRPSPANTAGGGE